jgi:hypothetical protein
MIGTIPPDPPKAKKPIAKKSAKRIESDKELKKIRIKKISEDSNCQIRVPGICTGLAVALNHIQKSTPKNRVVEKNLEQCCFACNNWIENNVEWAKQKGHQKSRFAK